MASPSSVSQQEAVPPASAAAEQTAPAVVAAIRAALPGVKPPVALHEPCFAGREWEYVKECLDTGWVSTAGAFVGRFERMLAEKIGAARAIATMNGTVALHACMLLAGVRPGDEVIMPTLTFVATANAVSHCGGIPHFVDSSPATFGLDPLRLERHVAAVAERRGGEWINRKTGRAIRAVVPVHIFGHPLDIDPVAALCRDLGLFLIEDAAEALGSFYKGRPVGRSGRLSAFSFNGNKTVTTGGGGAIATDDPDLAARAKHMTTTARLASGWGFDHDEVGYNYRMPNINAALGCAQLEQLDGFIARKRALAARYAAAFAGMKKVAFFTEPEFATSNYWLNAILLEDGVEARDAVLKATNAAGLQTRPAWTLMHRLPMYAGSPRDDLSVAESIADRLVNIPSSPSL